MKKLFGVGKKEPKLDNVRQVEKRIGQIIAYAAEVGDNSKALDGVFFTLKLDAGGPNSLLNKTEIKIEPLRICSIQTYMENSNNIPRPQTGSNSEYIPDSYVKNGNSITWSPPNGTVPIGKVVMLKIHFIPNANLEDGSKIVVRGYRSISYNEKVIGLDYIMRR